MFIYVCDTFLNKETKNHLKMRDGNCFCDNYKRNNIHTLNQFIYTQNQILLCIANQILFLSF